MERKILPLITFTMLLITLTPPVVAKVSILKPGATSSFGRISHWLRLLSYGQETEDMQERVNYR